MDQLAQAYPHLRRLGVEVVAIGPDTREALAAYGRRHALPFPLVADPSGHLLRLWGQQVRWTRLGRLPSLLAVDSQGKIVYVHRGRSMADTGDLAAALGALGKPWPPEDAAGPGPKGGER